MNERIKLLAELADKAIRETDLREVNGGIHITPAFVKFAELIVRECACLSYLDDSGNPEVEEALEFWRKNMLKHFGVKE